MSATTGQCPCGWKLPGVRVLHYPNHPKRAAELRAAFAETTQKIVVTCPECGTSFDQEQPTNVTKPWGAS